MLDLARTLVRRGPFTFVPWKDARQCYASFRGEHGAKAVATPLLSAPADNAKFKKTKLITYGLSLAQANMSGDYNTCRFSTPNCRAGCVSFAGKGELATVQNGRIRKTLFLAEHPNEFYTLLVEELEKIQQKHGTEELRVRMNTFSDLPWERLSPNIFEIFPRMRFYDYTKWGDRAIDANLGAFEWPGNYRLTFSASEKTSDAAIVAATEAGVNHAVLFDVKRGDELPSVWEGVQVLDGDKHDDRWDDPKFVIVGLRAKGRMRKGTWKMVRSATEVAA